MEGKYYIGKSYKNGKWYNLYCEKEGNAILEDLENHEYVEKYPLEKDEMYALIFNVCNNKEFLKYATKKDKDIRVASFWLTLLIVLCSGIAFNFLYDKDKNSEEDCIEEESYEEKLDHIKYILTKNDTINPEMKYYFYLLLEYLIDSKGSINLDIIETMSDKLLVGDFSDINITDKEKVVETIVDIMGVDDLTHYFLSLELYESCHQHDLPSKSAIFFENLNGEVDDTFISSLINEGDDFYFDYLKEKYNFDDNQIKEITYFSNELKDNNDNIFIDQYINKFLNYNYENYSFLNAMNEHIDSQYIMEGKCICNNNVFSDIINITINLQEPYVVYYDKKTNKDITDEVYREKFFYYMSYRINDKDIELVFKEDCMMIYLQTLSSFKNLEIPESVKDKKSYIDYLYDVGVNHLGNKMYMFLCNDDFETLYEAFVEQLSNDTDSVLTEDTMSFLIETIYALKREVKYGNLNVYKYDMFVNIIRKFFEDNKNDEDLMSFQYLFSERFSDEEEQINFIVKTLIDKYYFSEQDAQLELTIN